jgi:phosphatidylglycerophosphatase A
MRKLLGTFFGIGLIPGPGGTYASAVTAAILAPAYVFGAPWWSVAAAAAAATAIGVAIGRYAERDYAAEDPKPFVLDEVAGMLIAGLAAWTPWSLCPATTLAGAFLWFRVTDILKPPPVRQLERLHGGWGIMMDDVAAGLMALALAIPSLVVWNATEAWLRGP